METTNKTEKLRRIINESENIVFFGGAGVSTESGIPDFRSVDGIYNQHYAYPPETIISQSFFYDKPDEFYKFYKERLVFPDAKPNAAHLALSWLEKKGILKAVVTQNIDGLHQKAGSKTVYELHGSVHRNYCVRCGKSFRLKYVLDTDGVPYCPECGGLVKPDVVLYEEQLKGSLIEASIDAISNADTLIIGGTSLGVYPAAGLVRYFGGKTLVLINKTETPLDREATLVIRDPIALTLGKCVGKEA